jgi:hypothetical protein
MEYVIENGKEFDGSAYTIIGKNGKAGWSDKTRKDFENDNYTILSEQAFKTKYYNYLDSLCDHWSEVTEEKYYDMLGCLPPLKWDNGGFFISEMHIANISDFYQEMRGHYYTSLQYVSTPRVKILESLKKFIK